MDLFSRCESGFVAWVGQGTIADRTQEHLGRSDRGVIMMRRRFLADIEAIERGEDPKGIVRDTKANECISLPMIGREFYVDGLSVEQIKASPVLLPATPDQFPFLAGQPEEVRKAYEDAMGFEMKLSLVVSLISEKANTLSRARSKRNWRSCVAFAQELADPSQPGAFGFESAMNSVRFSLQTQARGRGNIGSSRSDGRFGCKKMSDLASNLAIKIRQMNPLLSDVVPFAVLLVMLCIRPWGLFGTREQLDRV
jgi:hypothetical protein